MTKAEVIKSQTDLVKLIGETVPLQKKGKEHFGLCPFHDDKEPSLAVDPEKQKWYCHSCDFGGDCFTWIQKLYKVDFKEALRILSDRIGVAPRPSVVIYDYLDPQSTLLFQVVRYEPKDFRQRRPDGKGDWIWNLKGITPVLYHLPEVLKAIEEGNTVYVVEGEKDADRLMKEGLIATTSPMGAGKWRPEYSDTLAGGNIVVLPDTDPPGLKHGQDICRWTYNKVKSLKLLELQGAKDVSEWLDKGGTIESLLECMKEEPEWTPEKTTQGLSQPLVSNLGDIYELVWETDGIKAEVRNVIENPNGISGEVKITDTDTNQKLLGSRLNFLADSTKAQVVKRLKEKTPDRTHSIDWETVIETIGDIVIERHRTGNPAKTKAELPDIVDDPYRVYPIVLEGQPTIEYGYGGSLKTYRMMLVGLLTHNGLACLDMEPKQGNVLWLDFENDEQTYKRRMTAVQNGLDCGELDFPLYKDCRGRTLAQLSTEIQRLVLAHNIKLTIVDSMTMAAGGYEYEQVVAYFRTLGLLGVASVTVDHRAKGADKGSSPIGSVLKRNIARLEFEVTAENLEGADYVNLTVRNTKNNDNLLLLPKGYRVEFENTGRIATKVTFSPDSPRTVTEVKVEKDKKQELLDYFKLHSNEYEAPTKVAIGVSGTADAHRKFMVRHRDVFESNGNGRWHIKDEVFKLIRTDTDITPL